MMPADLTSEATIYRQALLCGITGPAEIVAWADAWILRLDEIPDALVEAAYSGQRINEMLTGLNQLGSTTLTHAEVGMYAQMLKLYLEFHPSSLSVVTNALHNLALDINLSDDTSLELSSFNTRLGLTLSDENGCLDPYFSMDQIHQDVLQTLKNWAAPA